MANHANKLKIAAVSVLCGVGALFIGNFGAMCAAFAGDRSPSDFSMKCFMVWGVLGGVSLGVIPGLVVGRLMGMKRLGPWLAVAVSTGVSAIAVTLMAEEHLLPNNVNVLGPLHAAAVLAGAAVGALAFLPRTPVTPQQH